MAEQSAFITDDEIRDTLAHARPEEGELAAELLAHSAADEPFWMAERREQRERKLQRRIARDEAAWEDPKRRAAVYRRYLLASDLPDGVVRLLCSLTVEFGAGLENCFPSHEKMLNRLGGARRLSKARTGKRDNPRWTRGRSRLKVMLQEAAERGWCAAVLLTTAEDGELIEYADEHGGRFISATGRVFNIPSNVLAPGHPGLPGPRVWTRRRYAGRSAKATTSSPRGSLQVAGGGHL